MPVSRPPRKDPVICFCGRRGSLLPGGLEFFSLRDLFGRIPDEELAIAAYAVRITGFDRTTRFCGRCGKETRQKRDERSKICDSCGLVTYPRLSPAIVVLVQRDDRILLARSPHFPPGMFSLVAGFVEPGENLEHAVEREVLEETGIRVRNIRYSGSEPWPFPDSLMVGFFADFAGGELVVDRNEIESAFWFDREHLPRIPEKLSISRALIDRWMEEKEHGPALFPGQLKKSLADEINHLLFVLFFLFYCHKCSGLSFTDQKCFNRVY